MKCKRSPEIRFSAFSQDWSCSNVNALTTYVDYRGKTPLKTDDGVFLITAKNIKQGYIDYSAAQEYVSLDEYDAIMSRGKPKKGDVLFTTEAPMGNVALVDREDIALAQRVIKFRGKKQISNHFLLYYFSSSIFQKELAKKSIGSTVKGIKGAELKKMEVSFPGLEEQQKIANYLSAVDEKIRLLKEKHALLQQYKKGVMQKLFSQEIRFKDASGQAFPDWTEKRFEKCFERVTRKNKIDNRNVLTISAQRGLINQEKYFNKSVSAADVTGYYLLEKGEFAYNKSYSKGYPMGAIKRLNNYDQGVVSTLYICFKPINNQCDAFWEQFFEGGMLNREISKIAQEGARNHGLLNVSVTEFFHDMKVTVPCVDEQKKIAAFLQTLDKKLDAVQQQINLTQTFKKGLLQQMFV